MRTLRLGPMPSSNPEVRVWGEKPVSAFSLWIMSIWEQSLAFLIWARAVKISGAGFVCFTNLGARLQRGLIQFLLDLHTTEHGYVEICPPHLVRRECMVGTGQLPKFEEDAYGLEEGQIFLIPTAEVPLTNLYRDEILSSRRAAEISRRSHALFSAGGRFSGSRHARTHPGPPVR